MSGLTMGTLTMTNHSQIVRPRNLRVFSSRPSSPATVYLGVAVIRRRWKEGEGQSPDHLLGMPHHHSRQRQTELDLAVQSTLQTLLEVRLELRVWHPPVKAALRGIPG